MSLSRGERLGDWVVDRPLGEGGMGSVYRCHSVLASDVVAAVKVLKASEVGDFEQRFVQEMRTLAGLSHPAIVRVLGGGRREDLGLVYMAMELVDGEDLHHRLHRGPLSVPEALGIFGPVASALEYAHGCGIAHRDIKPANIMIRRDGTPVIVDFGIAVAEGHTRHTRDGMVPGTLDYLPPETFQGEVPTPRSTDAYAFGVVVWQGLTGKEPFPAPPESSEGQRLAQIMGLKLRGEALDPGAPVPEPVREAVRRTTDPEPRSRLVDMARVRELFSTAAGSDFFVPVPSPSRVTSKPRARRSIGSILVGMGLLGFGGAAALAALTMLGGLIWWTWPTPGPGTRDHRPPVELAKTLQEGAFALDRGDLSSAWQLAGDALDDHPEDPNANLLYGQVLLKRGLGPAARPYLCAALAGGLDDVPGVAEGSLRCERGVGARAPLASPLAVARLDLSAELASLETSASDVDDAVAALEEPEPEELAAAPAPSAAAPRSAAAPSRDEVGTGAVKAMPPPPPPPAPEEADDAVAEAAAPESMDDVEEVAVGASRSAPVSASKSSTSSAGLTFESPPEIEGALPPRMVRRILFQSRARLERCTRSLDSDGVLAMTLFIGTDGRVHTVRIDDDPTGGSREVGCLRTALLRTEFPTARGETTVTLRFRL